MTVVLQVIPRRFKIFNVFSSAPAKYTIKPMLQWKGVTCCCDILSIAFTIVAMQPSGSGPPLVSSEMRARRLYRVVFNSAVITEEKSGSANAIFSAEPEEEDPISQRKSPPGMAEKPKRVPRFASGGFMGEGSNEQRIFVWSWGYGSFQRVKKGFREVEIVVTRSHDLRLPFNFGNNCVGPLPLREFGLIFLFLGLAKSGFLLFVLMAPTGETSRVLFFFKISFGIINLTSHVPVQLVVRQLGEDIHQFS
ncbi:hypothetical protein BC829DRAFT_419385 [Chytridium lagenaria]|nr:hypothetical protein BC829DRAFT_419385 [Chytridium lagenaria]